MKKELNVNYKNNLRIEYIVIKCLIAASIISIILSLLFEFFPISLFKNAFLISVSSHFDYICNVMLGVSCSSFISLICLIFPFKTKADNQINGILNELREIYIEYNEINFYFYRESIGDLKNDNYDSDKMVLNKALKLKNDINEIELKYSNADFTSDNIKKIIDMLNNKLLLCIDVIERFYFVTIKPSNKEDNNSEKEKSIIDKNAEQEYFKALYKALDKILPINEFKSFFSKIITNDLYESTNHLIKELESINSLIIDSNKNKLKLYHTTLIANDLFKISNAYLKDYYINCDKIHARIKEIINHKNFKNETYKDTLQLVRDSKNKGDFNTANKYLDDIMKELTNN